MKTTSMKAVQEQYEAIETGLGWATDEYVVGLELTKGETYALLLILAEDGMLYNEEGLDDENIRTGLSPKDEYKMDREDVERVWNEYFSYKTDEAIRLEREIKTYYETLYDYYIQQMGNFQFTKEQAEENVSEITRWLENHKDYRFISEDEYFYLTNF